MSGIASTKGVSALVAVFAFSKLNRFMITSMKSLGAIIGHNSPH
jgi:hypothetical protein